MYKVSSIVDQSFERLEVMLSGKNKCKDCKHWKRLAETFGKCKAESSIVKGEYVGFFPKTDENDCCERFESRMS